MFNALKKFQTAQNLPATGTIKPGDETEQALNREAAKTPDGSYIWRTVEDDKVRGNHAAFSRTIRKWSDAPDPGEDFNCRCWAEPADDKAKPSVINDRQGRIRSILDNAPAIFDITVDPKSSAASPWYEDASLAKQLIEENDAFIEAAAKKYKVDADLIRAIMWSENARGSQLRAGYLFDRLHLSDTIMPMNINPDLWARLVTKTKSDLYKPKVNIEAAAVLLGRIHDRIANPTPAKIVAVWQYIGHEKTNDYSAYAERQYHEKPWEKHQ